MLVNLERSPRFYFTVNYAQSMQSFYYTERLGGFKTKVLYKVTAWKMKSNGLRLIIDKHFKYTNDSGSAWDCITG